MKIPFITPLPSSVNEHTLATCVTAQSNPNSTTLARTQNPPKSNRSLHRRRAARPARRPSLSIGTVLIFAALAALGATLFCWEFSTYRRWITSDRNPPDGVLIQLGQSTRFDMTSAFATKNPELIRGELANPPPNGGTAIHFICPISREGNFVMISFFLENHDRWILALPIP